jgi:hypothetical protein
VIFSKLKKKVVEFSLEKNFSKEKSNFFLEETTKKIPTKRNNNICSKNLTDFDSGLGNLIFFLLIAWNCSFPDSLPNPDDDDDDDGWPQLHSPGPFVTLGNGQVTGNGYVGSTSQHCTETRKVPIF